MMSKENRKLEIQKLVDNLLSNTLTAKDVLKFWPLGTTLNLIEESLIHEIRHYAEDADIRAKDLAKDSINKTYEEYQKKTIRQRLDEFLAIS